MNDTQAQTGQPSQASQVNHMERRIAQSRSAQFKRYLGTMEGEVGLSGRKMHEILSEHMRLRAEMPQIATQIEDLEIAKAELMREEDVQRVEVILEKLAQSYIQPAFKALGQYLPAGLNQEKGEALVRTLRYALIQLKKAQVEVQSMPLLLGLGCTLSQVELEALLTEIEKSPDWDTEFKALSQDKGVSSKWIAFLSEPEARKALMEFAQALMAAQILEEGILNRLETGSGSLPDSLDDATIRAQLLAHATSLNECLEQCLEQSKDAAIEEWDRNEVQLAEREAASQVSRIVELETQFERLGKELGLPVPLQWSELDAFHEACRLLDQKFTKRDRFIKMLSQRRSLLLEKSPKVKIATWKDRADSLIASRAKLEKHFKLDGFAHAGEMPSPDVLRRIAEALVVRGVFHAMSNTYKDAEKAFTQYAVPSSRKWTAIEMSESLKEWATWIEQCLQFETQPDFVAVFGEIQKGLEIPFDLCLDVLSWQEEVKTTILGQREEAHLSFEADAQAQRVADSQSYRESLVNFLISASPDSLSASVDFSKSATLKRLEVQLRAELKRENKAGKPIVTWSVLKAALNQKLQLLTQLKEATLKLNLREGIMLLEGKNLVSELEEVEFLISRLEQDPLLSQAGALLSEIYLGLKTDLAVLEPVKRYLQFLKNSGFPATVKQQLLSQFGPARLKESQSWVVRLRQSMSALTEHFEKIEVATEAKWTLARLREVPLDHLGEGLEADLKFSQDLPQVLESVTLESQALALGLEPLISWIKENPNQWDMKKVFRLAWHSSLLRVGMLGAKI